MKQGNAGENGEKVILAHKPKMFGGYLLLVVFLTAVLFAAIGYCIVMKPERNAQVKEGTSKINGMKQNRIQGNKTQDEEAQGVQGKATWVEEGQGIPDVVMSRWENNAYNMAVIANCPEIEDAESFAEEVVRMYEENLFYTTKFSLDLRGEIESVCFHVYLWKEDVGKTEELFQIRYDEGEIILDGMDGKS